MFKKMEQFFTTLYHERVKTRSFHKKEKGVDINIVVHIVDRIRKAGKNERVRIVLVSGDADYKPVVEYTVENKIPIDIWGWDDTMSSSYITYLKKKQSSIFLLGSLAVSDMLLSRSGL